MKESLGGKIHGFQGISVVANRVYGGGGGGVIVILRINYGGIR